MLVLPSRADDQGAQSCFTEANCKLIEFRLNEQSGYVTIEAI